MLCTAERRTKLPRAEEKTRTAFWLEKELLERCDICWKAHGFSSRNEFVNRAIENFITTQTLKNADDELTNRLASAIAKAADDGVVKISKGLFRYAVNQEIMMTLLAGQFGIKGNDISFLRSLAIKNVKKTRGKISLEDIADFVHQEKAPG